MKSKVMIQSVANAFSALEFIVGKTLENEGATLAEIAEYLGLQKSTVRNLLCTLESCGYICRKGFGFYALGDKCRRMSMVSETADKLRTLSIPLLSQFVRREKASIHLSVIFNGRRYTSVSYDQEGHLISGSQISDTRENVYRRAASRLLLAYSPPEEQERFFEKFGMPSPDLWPEAAADLSGTLEDIRKQKFACNYHNLANNRIGIAAGIFDRTGGLAAALSTSLPETELPPPKLDQFIKNLKCCADELTELFTDESLL